VEQQFVDAPQVDYIDEFVEVSAQKQGKVVDMVKEVPVTKVQKVVMEPQVNTVDRNMHIPALKQHHVPNVPVVQKFAKAPQVEFVDKIVKMPVQTQMQMSITTKQQTMVDVPAAKIVDKVVEVPAQKQLQVPMTSKLQKMVDATEVKIVDEVATTEMHKGEQHHNEKEKKTSEHGLIGNGTGHDLVSCILTAPNVEVLNDLEDIVHRQMRRVEEDMLQCTSDGACDVRRHKMAQFVSVLQEALSLQRKTLAAGKCSLRLAKLV